MGWLFYRSKVLIRKRILLHVERIARKLHKKEENGQRFPLGLCRGFVSLLGWITHSETYDWYLIHIKELVNVRKIKRIISKMTREVNRHAGMEKGTLQRAA
jgi:RNA-directed DNA polymerase